MNVIRHGHGAIRVPFIQPVQRFARHIPSCVIREGVAARRDANRDKADHSAFPR